MSKTVKVTYNADTLQTTITVDGQPFDTSRINGKEIEDWAYPFMMRKIKWNGFYDEMVEALGGDKESNVIFKGSDEALAELKEAWGDAPVTIISKEELENIVVIEHDEKTLTTNITVNGKAFDTSRINGKEIEDWIYPFMVRKVKWDGIFEELAKVVGSEDYTIQFIGSDTALSILSEKTPENISISNKTCDIPIDTPISDEVKYIFDSIEKMLWRDTSYFDDKSDEETEEIIELLNQYADKGNHDAICYIAFMALDRFAGFRFQHLRHQMYDRAVRVEFLSSVTAVISELLDEVFVSLTKLVLRAVLNRQRFRAEMLDQVFQKAVRQTILVCHAPSPNTPCNLSELAFSIARNALTIAEPIFSDTTRTSFQCAPFGTLKRWFSSHSRASSSPSYSSKI